MRSAADAEDEWTVLVYMNSDNNLECFGVQVGDHSRVEDADSPFGVHVRSRRRLLQLPSCQPPLPPTSLPPEGISPLHQLEESHASSRRAQHHPLRCPSIGSCVALHAVVFLHACIVQPTLVPTSC